MTYHAGVGTKATSSRGGFPGWRLMPPTWFASSYTQQCWCKRWGIVWFSCLADWLHRTPSSPNGQGDVLAFLFLARLYRFLSILRFQWFSLIFIEFSMICIDFHRICNDVHRFSFIFIGISVIFIDFQWFPLNFHWFVLNFDRFWRFLADVLKWFWLVLEAPY